MYGLTSTVLLVLFSVVGLATLGFFGVRIMKAMSESEEDE